MGQTSKTSRTVPIIFQVDFTTNMTSWRYLTTPTPKPSWLSLLWCHRHNPYPWILFGWCQWCLIIFQQTVMILVDKTSHIPTKRMTTGDSTSCRCWNHLPKTTCRSRRVYFWKSGFRTWNRTRQLNLQQVYLRRNMVIYTRTFRVSTIISDLLWWSTSSCTRRRWLQRSNENTTIPSTVITQQRKTTGDKKTLFWTLASSHFGHHFSVLLGLFWWCSTSKVAQRVDPNQTSLVKRMVEHQPLISGGKNGWISLYKGQGTLRKSWTSEGNSGMSFCWHIVIKVGETWNMCFTRDPRHALEVACEALQYTVVVLIALLSLAAPNHCWSRCCGWEQLVAQCQRCAGFPLVPNLSEHLKGYKGPFTFWILPTAKQDTLGKWLPMQWRNERTIRKTCPTVP